MHVAEVRGIALSLSGGDPELRAGKVLIVRLNNGVLQWLACWALRVTSVSGAAENLIHCLTER